MCVNIVKLEEVSTHMSGKTRAGNVFLCLGSFDLSIFEISCEKQTNTKSGGKNPTRDYRQRGYKLQMLQMLNVTTNKSLTIIRLEARFQPNIGFTLRRVLAVFTRSAITPKKVNRFGWNLEHSEYTVGDWPWHILGAIRIVATSAGEPGEILFFCQVSNARFHRFPVG